MPSGKVHQNLELSLLPPLLLSLLLLDRALFPKIFHLHHYAIFTLAYLFSVYLLSPDLDQHHCEAKKNWGILQFLWWPYSKIFVHRGVSHHPLLGPWSRLLYLALLLLPPYLLLQQTLHPTPTPITNHLLQLLQLLRQYPSEFLLTLLGLFCPNWLHIALDHWNSQIRKTP
ncbi:MAG: hypothetical protein D6805_08385 [Planctomycetota bacterium]|nr:MAG: hypothetical protein D6805_08385 [Planctomycetota bacterium]